MEEQYRMFSIVQEKKFLTEQQIEKTLSSFKTIGRYAYILHDKDTYLLEDEMEDPNHKANTPKPAHWHIFIELKTNRRSKEAIAKWFYVPIFCVNGLKGRNVAFNTIEYFLHKTYSAQAEQKHQYDEIEVKSNFNWQEFVNEKYQRYIKCKEREKNTSLEYIKYLISQEGISFKQINKKYPLLCSNEFHILQRLRSQYLISKMPVPNLRINFYICGKGGIGKGLMSRAIARALFPNIENDDEIFFEVGTNGVTFDGYDGQPVIIWNDRRYKELLKELGGKKGLFNTFDSHPSTSYQNVKFSMTALRNKINIVNSVQPYKDFINGLVLAHSELDETENEDPTQSFRRFPFIIEVHENNFDLFCNKKFCFNVGTFDQYEGTLGIHCNISKIAKVCYNDKPMQRAIENKVLQIVVQKYTEAVNNNQKHHSIDEKAKLNDEYSKTKIDGVTDMQITGTSALYEELMQLSID